MAFTSSFNRCQLAVIIILSKICIANANNNNSVTWTQFFLMKSAGAINQSIVTRTYYETNSSLKCAIKCKHLTATSFYHLNDSVTCYCNNQTDNNIVADDNGSVVHGYPLKPGTVSECQDIYNMGFRTVGEFTTSTGKKILCNLTNLGWTVFQRRIDGNVEFQRNWTEYVAGFGDATGEFWLGLEELHQLSQSGCELHVYLEAEPDHPVKAKGYARYSNFSVGTAGTNYALHVDGFSGNVGDSLSFHNGCPFSTVGADHDAWPTYNCAFYKIGGWWYNGGLGLGGNFFCHYSNLNSLYKGGEHEGSSGIRWILPWGEQYSLLRTEMALRC